MEMKSAEGPKGTEQEKRKFTNFIEMHPEACYKASPRNGGARESGEMLDDARPRMFHAQDYVFLEDPLLDLDEICIDRNVTAPEVVRDGSISFGVRAAQQQGTELEAIKGAKMYGIICGGHFHVYFAESGGTYDGEEVRAIRELVQKGFPDYPHPCEMKKKKNDVMVPEIVPGHPISFAIHAAQQQDGVEVKQFLSTIFGGLVVLSFTNLHGTTKGDYPEFIKAGLYVGYVSLIGLSFLGLTAKNMAKAAMRVATGMSITAVTLASIYEVTDNVYTKCVIGITGATVAMAITLIKWW